MVAEALPGETALALVDAANVAFVDAMTTGYVVSAIFVASAGVIALTMIPRRMREVQATEDDIPDVGIDPTAPPQPAPQPGTA